MATFYELYSRRIRTRIDGLEQVWKGFVFLLEEEEVCRGARRLTTSMLKKRWAGVE
jgi:hypothetical protein